MVRYRRNFVPGGTFFFTLTLADRNSAALVEHIGALRAAFRVTRSERPFAIDAIVILPDHLHAIRPSAGRRRGLFRPVAPDQELLHSVPRCCRRTNHAQCQGRVRSMATAILGAHHSPRPGFRAACRLHSLQSGETRFGDKSLRLAVFVVPPVRTPRLAAPGLGRNDRRAQGRLRREAVARMEASGAPKARPMPQSESPAGSPHCAPASRRSMRATMFSQDR